MVLLFFGCCCRRRRRRPAGRCLALTSPRAPPLQQDGLVTGAPVNSRPLGCSGLLTQPGGAGDEGAAAAGGLATHGALRWMEAVHQCVRVPLAHQARGLHMPVEGMGTAGQQGPVPWLQSLQAAAAGAALRAHCAGVLRRAQAEQPVQPTTHRADQHTPPQRVADPDKQEPCSTRRICGLGAGPGRRQAASVGAAAVLTWRVRGIRVRLSLFCPSFPRSSRQDTG